MKYLYEEKIWIYAKCTNCDRVLKFKKYELDEVKTGVECFCGNFSDVITGLPKLEPVEMNNTEPEPIIKGSAKYPQAYNVQYHGAPTGPKCPTCGSQSVQKISFASKAVGGAMFGLFSSDVRNTYKCNSCGYKW